METLNEEIVAKMKKLEGDLPSLVGPTPTNDADFSHWFQKHIYQCSLHHARPIFAPCTLRAPCTEAKRGVLGSKSSDIYVFGISEENLKKWAYYGPNLRTFLKKILFHPRVPPLYFDPFWAICPAPFGLG